MVDFGMAAKVRPALLLTGKPADDELDLVTVLLHTTVLRGNRWELDIPKPFLKPGAFHLQQVQTVSTVKLERRLGVLTGDEINRVRVPLPHGWALNRRQLRHVASRRSERRSLIRLRLAFKDDALRQFIYAAWRQFLDANSRKKKWTTGKKPEPIYPLLVNTLEPLAYFSPGAGDNLRTIRDLMKSVAAEAGSADLAAVESEIQQLDREIDQRVYELYGLTPDEIKIVEGTIA